LNQSGPDCVGATVAGEVLDITAYVDRATFLPRSMAVRGIWHGGVALQSQTLGPRSEARPVPAQQIRGLGSGGRRGGERSIRALGQGGRCGSEVANAYICGVRRSPPPSRKMSRGRGPRTPPFASGTAQQPAGRRNPHSRSDRLLGASAGARKRSRASQSLACTGSPASIHEWCFSQPGISRW
jgi:hypothetical protein